MWLELPPEFSQGSLSGLLDRVFPSDEAQRREIASRFDLRANPDLPDIYAVFLEVCAEWRDWRCALAVSLATGDGVDLDAAVSHLLAPGPDTPLLSLHLEQQYRALEYAVRHGFWPSRAELLGWLRSLTALYFLDKHEVRLDAGPDAGESGPALASALDALQSQGLIAPQDSEDAPLQDAAPDEPSRSVITSSVITPFVITAEGRRFIGRLLDETESLIELYDHYQDTIIDLDRDLVEFGTGRGIDLRVQAFLAEGLAPVHAVFLLRLYDGTLDAHLSGWTSAIEDEEFYEGILEPVVNRYGVDPAAMERVIESGYAWLEERQEQARREEAQREILRRAGRTA